MKSTSTTDHIFTLRQVMEKYYEYNKDLLMIFINFQQAYDSSQKVRSDMQEDREMEVLGKSTLLV